ncbi:flagellar basal body rod protein FlgB [Bacillus sp. OG2]|nr:flagellar basal body rod protein FlgB [Bacillus sp. OG2]
MSLFSGTIGTLESAVNYSAVKQKAISQNIANVDTPNYKSKNVSFKAVLDNEIWNFSTKKTDYRHFDLNGEGQNGIHIRQAATSYNHNGNNVDLDKEMTELAENQIYYNALVERLNGKFSSLQNVIRGGK